MNGRNCPLTQFYDLQSLSARFFDCSEEDTRHLPCFVPPPSRQALTGTSFCSAAHHVAAWGRASILRLQCLMRTFRGWARHRPPLLLSKWFPASWETVSSANGERAIKDDNANDAVIRTNKHTQQQQNTSCWVFGEGLKWKSSVKSTKSSWQSK